MEVLVLKCFGASKKLIEDISPYLSSVKYGHLGVKK
jgi:hypothetical protein